MVLRCGGVAKRLYPFSVWCPKGRLLSLMTALDDRVLHAVPEPRQIGSGVSLSSALISIVDGQLERWQVDSSLTSEHLMRSVLNLTILDYAFTSLRSTSYACLGYTLVYACRVFSRSSLVQHRFARGQAAFRARSTSSTSSHLSSSSRSSLFFSDSTNLTPCFSSIHLSTSSSSHKPC